MTKGRSIVFRTDRLIVRPATEDDVNLFFSLWTNPRVMSNVGFPDGLRITREDVRTQIQKQGNSEFDQLLVVVLKATGESLGECKMHRPNSEGVARTDVKLLPEFWGNKYGVEVKKALLSHLFTHTDCVAVEASPNVGNIASIKMQEAVGGIRIKEGLFEFPDEMRDYTTPVHHYVYRVERRNWRAWQLAPANEALASRLGFGVGRTGDPNVNRGSGNQTTRQVVEHLVAAEPGRLSFRSNRDRLLA
jgi:RimJ/RimL family protein N-acetyltransferase